MRVQDLDIGARLRPQKPTGSETPHVTIETNTTCNIRCRYCYAIEEPVVKPVSQILAEIDYALARRRLETVSLLGGEPTLHPELPEVVRYVKSRRLHCQVLTNGVLYLRDGQREVFERIVQAGVDRILVHLDTGQAHVHPDLRAARHRMHAFLDELGVWHGASITLYQGEEPTLPGVLRDLSRYSRFDGALVTLALDFERAFRDPEERRGEPDMATLAAQVHEQLGVEPCAYVPTNLDADEVGWLMWFYWINADTGETLGVSPELNRALKSLYRRTHDHHYFGAPMGEGSRGLAFLASAAAELALHPAHAAEAARVLRHAHGGRDLRFQYIVAQQAPYVDPETGLLHFCWQCPDATVRNGRLTPVCIAGRVNPLGQKAPTAPQSVVHQVFHHLGEPVPHPIEGPMRPPLPES